MTKTSTHGGPAFPEIGNVSYNSDWQNESGMTLREWYAGRVMPVFTQAVLDASAEELKDIARVNNLPGGTTMPGIVAFLSYAYADAMIAARTPK